VLGDDKPKYLNSPETPVFSKGRELYGLFEARSALREQGYVLVTEGYMDVVALAQLGFPNAVATLGTACTTEHVQKLFRFTDSVVFSFDGDAAGRRAARKALDGALPYATDVRSIKFLFLPAEHDPDSFIRANGREAFARYVSEATPLSRFLIESAREGLDLNTAEGRAHLSSNARPLWSVMPEGALKMQLLGELADLVQLTGRELSALWNPAAATAAKPARDGSWRKDKGAPGQGNFAKGGYGQAGYGSGGSYGAGSTRVGGRARPTSRAEHATRILLGQSALWDTLSNEDHGLLCALPEPNGPLLAWLEAQMHEHGPLPWEALREALAGHAGEALALRLMSDPTIPVQPESESAPELRDLLNRMLVEHLKVQETEAIEASKSDPSALQRYQALRARRVELMASLEKSQSEGIIQG
jgi:DNA primase